MEASEAGGGIGFLSAAYLARTSKASRPRFCDAIAGKASNQLQVAHGPHLDRLHMAGFV